MKIPEKAKETVKDTQSFLKQKGIYLSCEQVFEKLIEYKLLDVFGNPTQFALENGYAEIV